MVAIIFLKILQQILATTQSSSKEQDTSGSVLMGDAESISVTSSFSPKGLHAAPSTIKSTGVQVSKHSFKTN